jgi:hypothetical protein
MQGAGDAEKDQAIQKFRSLLNEYKRPYLADTLRREEYSQDTAKLGKILGEFDKLYKVLSKEINPVSQAGGSLPDPLDPNTRNLIVRSFQARGGLDYLKQHPDARDSFNHYLIQDLKKFPFTVSTKQIDTLESDKVTAAPRTDEIIPNEELVEE